MKKRENNKVNIYLILADENLFHPHYLRGLISKLENNRFKIVGITISKDNYKHGFINAVLSQINLWGILPFSFIVFNTLIRSMFFRLGLRNRDTIAGIGKIYKIPVTSSFNVNEEPHLKYLKQLNIDILISSNGQIFKKELLGIPKMACINRHSALLPKYGGVLPIFWAMKNGEKILGSSVHVMVEKIDQGDILSFKSFKNLKGNSLFYNYMIAFDISVDVTINGIQNLIKGKTVKRFLPNRDQYYSFPNKQDIREFKKNNKSFNMRDIKKFYSLYTS